MKRKLLFFINPISGSGKNNGLVRIIEDTMEKHFLSYEIMDTNKEGHYGFLPDKIIAEKITDIIICGGDGSINQVASFLQKSDVSIGIIPLGSGNGLALAAGIPTNSVKALEIICRGQSSYIDAISINQRFSCMLCGLGFDAQVAHDFAKQSTRGLATYVSQTIRNFFTLSAYPFLIEAGGKRLETEAYFISIANSNQFGNHVTIAPMASLSDGLLDIVVVNKSNKFSMVLSLIRQIRQGKLQEALDPAFSKKNVHYFQTDHLMIHNLSLAPLHIDGEAVRTSEKLEIRVLPAAIRLLKP